MWWVLAFVLLLGSVALAWRARDEALLAKGRAEERVRALTAQLHRDSLTAHRADSVVRVDTIRLVRWTRDYDTIRTTLRITDTVQVKQFVGVADSVVSSCRRAVSSLALSCAAKDTIIVRQRAIIAAQQESHPVPQRTITLGLTAGYGATLNGGRVRTGPSATVGVTWHPF